MGYCGAYHEDGQYESITAGANESPMYLFSTRYSSNSELPTAKLYFKTSVAPNTQNLYLQVYRYGSTNAWETVQTYNTAGCTGTDNCYFRTQPAGTPSEYYESDGSDYWVHYRLYQESGAGDTTLYIDSFTAHQPQQPLRGGRVFREEITDPLRW